MCTSSCSGRLTGFVALSPCALAQVEWSKCGDPELELVREGNPQGECPTVFVNHMAYWGPCQKAQDGLPCNCPM
jgi:hypothetical protein